MPVARKTGEVLRGRYRIRERIGQGGMGAIYLADDLRLEGRRCALKEVEHDRSVPAKLLKEARQQFLHEATVLARLDHPNLPKVSDFFSIGQHDYLVMDYIPGKDLRALMLEAKQNNTFLAEEEVLRWANQLADALTYLHGQTPPLVHRDVKPSNLKITPNGLLKLVDFGLVKALVPDEMTITVIQGRGTALYTPLEQYGGDGLHTDIRSDIYAFGCTLYHLLTNTPPVDARQRFLQPDSMPAPRKLNPAISSRTERAILWAMELHPDDRPATAEEMRQYMLGTRELPARPPVQTAARVVLSDIFERKPDQILLLVAAGLLVVSLIASLVP
ncbi:MAG TPA: serine/threonine-protein kinase [Anaerolineales bacterium]|nr:serine/threonine-protein kinase [Anaerolineales bacterium]